MNSIFMRFPNGKFKALALSYDDATIHDKKLVEILDRYGLKATFNISTEILKERAGDRYLSEAEIKSVYEKGGHEAAIHTAKHAHIAHLPDAFAMAEIVKDKERLEEIFGTVVTGGAYPYGDYNDKVVEMLRLSGIKHCRATWGTRDFRIPTDWLVMRPTCHHKDEKLWELTDKFINSKVRLDVPFPEEAKLFILWGHSYEFDGDNNWDLIEEFAKKTSGMEDTWYATVGEICDYVECYNRLEFSTNGKIVKNPNFSSVWFCVDNNTYEIKGGETLYL